MKSFTILALILFYVISSYAQDFSGTYAFNTANGQVTLVIISGHHGLAQVIQTRIIRRGM